MVVYIQQNFEKKDLLKIIQKKVKLTLVKDYFQVAQKYCHVILIVCLGLFHIQDNAFLLIYTRDRGGNNDTPLLGIHITMSGEIDKRIE